MTEPKPKSSVDPHRCPAAWFAVLEHARLHGDFERAARAKRELRRLGVIVDFVPPMAGEVSDAE